MSHYIHKSIPDAKFEADSSSSFGDITSQNFPRKKETSHQMRLFPPGKRVSIFFTRRDVRKLTCPTANELLFPELFSWTQN